MKSSFFKKTMSACISVVLLYGFSVNSFAYEAKNVANYSDVTKDHWAYASVKRVTENGIMTGKGDITGTYFDEDAFLTPCEMLTTFYRIAGESEFSAVLDGREVVIHNEKHRGRWYSDAMLWSSINGLAGHYQYGEQEWVDGAAYSQNFVSRTDVVMAMNMYVENVLNIKPQEKADLNQFADWRNSLKSSTTYLSNREDYQWFEHIYDDAIDWSDYLENNNIEYWSKDDDNDYILWKMKNAWSWAVGSGIIKGYPDRTLHCEFYYDPNEIVPCIQYTGSSEAYSWNYDLFTHNDYITRAEFAVILDRFMNYIESVK